MTRAASVQFTEPMMFRVIRVHDWRTYDGWAWLDGYQLNAVGEAVARRSIFVRVNGLQPARSDNNHGRNAAKLAGRDHIDIAMNIDTEP